MKLPKFLIFLSFPAYILGVVGELPFQIRPVSIYLIDLIAFLCLVYWLLQPMKFINISKTHKSARLYIFFIFIGLLSNIFSPLPLGNQEKLISLMYLFRITIYFFYFVTLIDVFNSDYMQKEQVKKLLFFAGLFMAILGWIQYFLYPDLRNLYYLGWDPHYKRIFSTFLDPNYFGLIMLETLILGFFSNFKFGILKICNLITLLITLAFTYSRSSYLSLLVVAFSYGFILRKKIFFIFASIFIVLLFILLPKPMGEGVNLFRTFSIQERINNWHEGVDILLKYPVLGIGYNRLRYFRQIQSSDSKILFSHAAAGIDNSFLYIASTMGLFGLTSLLVFLRNIYLNGSIFIRLSIIAIILHSFFQNSLFFPSILYFVMVLAALETKKIKENIQ